MRVVLPVAKKVLFQLSSVLIIRNYSNMTIVHSFVLSLFLYLSVLVSTTGLGQVPIVAQRPINVAL